MTVLWNDPVNFKEETITGFTTAYSRYVKRIPDASGVMSIDAPQAGKVAVLIGGGSGHYPAFCGYVGPGLAAAAAMGDIFTSPSTEQIYRCTKAIAPDPESSAGVIYSYGNYAGDVMNFDMAAMRLEMEGIEVRTVLVTDDLVSAPKGEEEERRGIAGDFYVFKVAGASAARGDSLEDVEKYARLANDRCRSFGVAFGGCTLPGKSAPLFNVEEGKIEWGLGVHGEPGIKTDDMRSASEIGTLLVETVLSDVPDGASDQVAVMINGLGNTKYEEMFVMYNAVAEKLTAAGLRLHNPIIDEMVTSLDMMGCSLTLFWLDDDLQPLLDAPCQTPAFTQI